MLHAQTLQRQVRRNRRDTVLLLGGIALLMTGAGWLVAGGMGALASLAAAAVVLAVNPRSSIALLRTMWRAVPLPLELAPELWRLHVELCRRAGLELVPPLLYIPSNRVLALSSGWGRRCAIALSDGTLRQFPPREIAAILAHEIAHIRAGDLKLLRLADTASHLTHVMSMTGLLMLVMMLPGAVEAGARLNSAALLAIVLAPLASDLARLKLSRIREFAADTGAAQLCGDPEALAHALARLGDPSLPLSPFNWLRLIRTHPSTAERIRRLRELSPVPGRLLSLPELLLGGPLRWR